MKIVQVVLRHKREICTVGVALGIVGVMTGCEKKTQEAPILAQADLVIYAVQEPSVYQRIRGTDKPGGGCVRWNHRRIKADAGT